MYGRTNAGGGVTAKGFIQTTYPEGSICTCSNGTRTLKARDTSGYMMFILPSIGTWTVTATDPADPTNTDSETVEITKESESVSVELSFGLWLIKNGVLKVPFKTTGRRFSDGVASHRVPTFDPNGTDNGFYVLGLSGNAGTNYFGNSFETENPLVISEYSTLYVECEAEVNNYGSYEGGAIVYGYSGSAPSYNNDMPMKADLANNTASLTTYSADVSAISSMVIGVDIRLRSGAFYLRIKNMWLE